MYRCAIFKVDNKFYLYSIALSVFLDWEYSFDKIFNIYIAYVEYQQKHFNIPQKHFSLHIRKLGG